MARNVSSSLEPLYRQAAAETAKGSKSFYFATRFFPPDLARSAHSVYWFCRHTDDLADECGSLDQGRRDIEEWSARLKSAEAGATASHPVLQLFLHTAHEYEIPLEYAHELIEGMRMDLNQNRYPDFATLRLFCYRVASVVGLMMSCVIGFKCPSDRDRGLRHAIDLGIGMQLTNILRDIGEDRARGRIYLPQDEMARFGYPESKLLAGERNAEFASLMRFQVNRAQEYYRNGNAGIPLLNRRGRFAVKVASDVYREILQRVVSSRFDVFNQRAVVPAGRKYWLTVQNMALPIMCHSAARLAFWREA